MSKSGNNPGGDPLSNPSHKDPSDKLFTNPKFVRYEVAKPPYRVPNPSDDLKILWMIVLMVVILYLVSSH